jgi:hypothetical protein
MAKSGYDPFVVFNLAGGVAFTFIADIRLFDEAWLIWESAASFAANSNNTRALAVFNVWPLIQDARLLQRALSIWRVAWGAPATLAEMTAMSAGEYSMEKNRHQVFCYQPKTAQCLVSGLIAARLPHLVEKSEVVAFLPTAEAQFRDLVFQIFSTGLPLSLVCSLVARHLGEKHQAAMHAKAELSNLNPLKQAHAHIALASAQNLKAKD